MSRSPRVRSAPAGPWLLVGAGLVALLGCAPVQSQAPGALRPAAKAPPATAEVATTAATIDRLVGAASCTDDSQCRVAPIGSRPCGGPAGFRAWSLRDTRAEQLEPVLQAHAEAQRAENERIGMQSTCQVLPVPSARCQRTDGAPGRCVLVSENRAIR
jgi:hypothetical protein